MLEEGRVPRVPRSRGAKVPRTKISQSHIQIRAWLSRRSILFLIFKPKFFFRKFLKLQVVEVATTLRTHLKSLNSHTSLTPRTPFFFSISIYQWNVRDSKFQILHISKFYIRLLICMYYWVVVSWDNIFWTTLSYVNDNTSREICTSWAWH